VSPAFLLAASFAFIHVVIDNPVSLRDYVLVGANALLALMALEQPTEQTALRATGG
jgi:hypothetical protein